jgi:hypothetical protein
MHLTTAAELVLHLVMVCRCAQESRALSVWGWLAPVLWDLVTSKPPAAKVLVIEA